MIACLCAKVNPKKPYTVCYFVAMYKGKTVSVVIPTYNEEGSIRAVINGFFDTGVVDEVVVIDNNALGNTKLEVAKTKARLIEEKERSEEHTSELQSQFHLVCRLLLEKK